VDRLAAQLRGTGIHDLFVHSGPFGDDGTLDPGLLPEARWLTAALHAAIPGVRVQAWLGAHPVSGQLSLDSPATRTNLLSAVGQVLDDGFDGVHYDFEPVRDGDPDPVNLLQATHTLTRQRHAVPSVSAIHTEPMPGVAAAVGLLPGRTALWSGGYLRQVARQVDQVAVMAYDTGLPTQATYGGYVRRATAGALAAVPLNVTLFIGVPAYHDEHLTHHA
jgi:spore germination protein YaaH